MLNWLSSLWSNVPTMYGPGRNAPTEEGGLKRFLEQRPTQVIIVTQDVITQTRNGLRKTEINAVPPLSQKPAIMQEFDVVFAQGFGEYFKLRRQQRGEPEPKVVEPVSIIQTPLVVIQKVIYRSEDDESEESWSDDETLASKQDIIVEETC